MVIRTPSHSSVETSTEKPDASIAATPGVVKPDAAELAEVPKGNSDIQGPEVLSARRFIPIFFGLLLAIFIVSLDNTVVATAQVDIVNHLGGADLIAWLPTTFLIGQAVFALVWGQVLGDWPTKGILILSMALFELGSLVCALAPTIDAVLAGRTISGAGAAGIMSAGMQTMAETTSLKQRPIYFGLLGMIFTMSMVVGPIIGGALDSAGWQWVFWVNLPIGGLGIALVILLLPLRPALGTSISKPTPYLQRFKNIDVVGTAILTGSLCTAVIPIQEATTNGWHSAKTWVPIALALPIFALYFVWARWYGEKRAVLPLSIFRDLNVVGCAIISFSTFWLAILYIYEVPASFQEVHGRTPTQSGVDILAMMISNALASLFGGILARKSGHYFPQLVVAPVLGAIGAGLIYLTKVDTGLGLQIGSQILLGVGIGAIIQLPMLAIQANSEKSVISKATALSIYAQRFGGGVGSSVSVAILYGQFPSMIRTSFAEASLDATPYLNIQPTTILTVTDQAARSALQQALTRTINLIYISGVPFFALICFATLAFVKITNIKTEKSTEKRHLFRQAARVKAPETSAA